MRLRNSVKISLNKQEKLSNIKSKSEGMSFDIKNTVLFNSESFNEDIFFDIIWNDPHFQQALEELLELIRILRENNQ